MFFLSYKSLPVILFLFIRPSNGKLLSFLNWFNNDQYLNLPPRADEIMNFGYNIFLGMTPEQQRGTAQGYFPQLFEYTTCHSNTDSTYTKYDQFEELVSQSTCDIKLTGKFEAMLSGSASLDAALVSEASGHVQYRAPNFFEKIAGFFSPNSQKVLTFEKVLIAGNSKASVDAQAKLEASFEFGFNNYHFQELYVAENDFRTICTWTEALKKSAEQLRDAPSDLDVLKFFADWGTHGISRGSFGSKCWNTIYMKGGFESSAFASLISALEINMMLGDQSEFNGEAEAESSGSIEGAANSYLIAGRSCAGTVPKMSRCFPNVPDFLNPEPILLDFTYEAIWDMEVPNLTSGAKEKMTDIAFRLLEAGAECGENHCSGNGACVPNPGAWENLDRNHAEFSVFWKEDHCICYDDNVVDSKCSNTKKMHPQKWTNWYAHMEDNPEGNVSGHQGDPGPAGEWVFTRRSDGTYLISQKQWDNWYMYMEDDSVGNVRGWESDPGPQGHWILKRRDDGTYLLSTKEWPDCFMYMLEDSPDNVQGWWDDPGAEGYWVLEDV